jgi:hypothetical protein
LWWPDDAVVGAQVGVLQVADGSVDPAPVAAMTTAALSPTSSVTVTR